MLNALLVYDDRYIKTKTKTYGDNVYKNLHRLNVPEGDIECSTPLRHFSFLQNICVQATAFVIT